MDNRNYTFEHDNDTWHVDHEGDKANVLDAEGDSVVEVTNDKVWPSNEAMPIGLAKIALDCYRQGVLDGDKQGYWRCQYDVKKVLGM